MTFQLSEPLQYLSAQLETVAPTVVQHAVEVGAVMQERLTAAELQQWSQHCVQIAHSGWRTGESTAAFLQVSPFLLQRLPVAQLWTWAEHGQAFASASAEVATAFFRAAKPFLHHAPLAAFTTWVTHGQWYLQQHPTFPSLAVEYFHLSPAIYGHYAPPAAALWAQLGQDFARLGLRHGRAFFATSQAHLEQTADVDQAPAWEQAKRMLPHAVDTALGYLERYADLARRFGADGAAKFRAIIDKLLTPAVSEANAFLRLAGSTLAFVPMAERLQILDWCDQIAAVSHAGVLDFLQHILDLRRRLPGQRLQPWITMGIDRARDNAAAGQAYFALESAAAQDHLQALQNLVAFAHEEHVLQLYTEALLGRKIALRPTTEAPDGLQMAGRDLPTSDGGTIFVPAQVSDFATAHDNFAAYKVAILHQIGFYEYGTFGFQFTECCRRLPPLRQRLEQMDPTEVVGHTTAFERFFAVFSQPLLARTLFTMLEDMRIDAILAQRYKGIRADLALIMQYSVQHRPALQDLPLRQALLEGMLQLTLGARLSAALPPTLRLLLQRLGALLQPLQALEATVYDTAATVLVCYELLIQISARAAAMFSPAMDADLAELDAELVDDADMIALADFFRQAGESADSMPTLPEGAEPADGVDPVPYRGDMKPELIQKKMQLDELAEALQNDADGISPLSPEALKELLENNDIDIKSIQAGDLTATSGLFVSDLEGREGMEGTLEGRQEDLKERIDTLRAELEEAYGDLSPQGQTFLYDEWDYQIGDYRRSWCRLSETPLADAGTAFVEETRQQHAELLRQVSRQFQMLKPEMFKKIKRLSDGEEIDLDSAVEAFVDRRAGNILSDRVYLRRNKRDRSVAAVFLLDMSASTDDEVKEPDDALATPKPASPAPRHYDFSGFIQEDQYYAWPAPKQPPAKPKRRIIDVEREALVLMAEALEGLGDAYAVYGFSGYGRDQVEAFVVKEFTDPYDARVQGRIGAMKPHRSTRMGPAIRHAIHKLERQDARIKTLLLLSDGYPQDFDYGKDRKSKDYGIQDTMMALHEARLKGIQTFCITVDPAGHDYLRQMCPDQQYLVIEDITELPNELPKVYRGLTT